MAPGVAVGRDDADALAAGERLTEIGLLAVDDGGHGRLGEPRSDARRQVGGGGPGR